MNLKHHKIIQFTALLMFLGASTHTCFAETNACGPSEDESLNDEAIQDIIAEETDSCDAPDVDAISIQETMENAYMQNTALDAARAGLRATDETVSQAIGDWRPSLSVRGSEELGQTYLIGEGVRRHTSTTGYQASITQNIYKGGETDATIGQTESNVLAGRAELFNTEQSVLLKAIQAHTDILKNMAIVNYRKQNEEAYKKIQDFAQSRFEVGLGSYTDVEAAKGDYEAAKAELDRALSELDKSKAAYLRQIGTPPGNLSPGNVIVPIPAKYDQVLEIAKAHNPIVLKARYALEAAFYNVDLQMSGLLPKVNVGANVGNNRALVSTNTPKTTKRTDIGFSTTVDVPIYLQGIPNSKIRQAYQQVAQQKVSLVGAQREVVEAARIAWANLIAARESLKGFLASVKAQEVAVEGAYEEVNVGTKTIIDVLQIEQRLINVQIDLANAQQNLIIAGYQVLQAMGRLTARDLHLNVTYYDPDAYYNEYKEAWIQFWQGKDYRYVKDGNSQ
ncbi:MAG: hypothetical protein A2W46_03270 [Alphaproteobacteria bacterium RIFCSPHIGHO2_12_42_13]|nr:MAG: hypothetical protein A2W46_03270 [Alphaproteobacteria bacterium RIFCSPHIGHO2_12_42_13]